MTRVLLDTSILIAIARDESERLGRTVETVILASDNSCHASVASLWEIAIKTRLGKLDPIIPLENLPQHFSEVGIRLLAIDHHHVLAELDEIPDTRDPFDRLLLAQCQVENLRLVTEDRALAEHPLAWRGR